MLEIILREKFQFSIVAEVIHSAEEKRMKKQILIMEDERIVADDIKMILQRLGYSVSGTAISGEEAVKKGKSYVN